MRQVVRPRQGERLVILANGDGAVVALNALADGLRVDGLVLSAPRWADAAPPPAGLFSRDDAPPAGWRAWRKTDSAAQPASPREGLAAAWQGANPDLRMTTPSRGWRRAFAAASQSALAGAARVRTPVVTVGPVTGAAPCPRLPACRRLTISTDARAPHLARDELRGPWLNAVRAFVLTGGDGGDPAAPR